MVSLLTVARRLPAALTATLVLVAVTAASTPAQADAHVFPREIALPDQFQPEGIAIGPGAIGYFGSLRTGDIYAVRLATGRGRVVASGTPGHPSVGLKTDRRGRLFVAGGTAGDARVIDLRTGRTLASYQLGTPEASFVNDVVLTRNAAYFTDSLAPVLYKVPLGRNGEPGATAVHIPLGGDFVQLPGLNANGIAPTPDRRGLLIVSDAHRALFRVDPATGNAVKVALTGGDATNGDGLLLDGRTLYIVQNQLNRVAVFRLNRDGTEGTLIRLLTSDRFDVPTTVAKFGRRLYLPNARFGTTPEPTTKYWVTAIDSR